MAGLLDQFMAYIDANTPRNTRKPVNAGTVIDQGLLGGRIGQVPQRAQEMYQGLLGAPAELAALGSPAMRSQVDQAMTKPQPIDKDKAMQMAMDTLQTTSPVGGLAGMFIGKGAKTWDAIAAQKADDLLKKGIDPREVWKQTGTLKGVDGALRQEIPDNLAELSRPLEMGRNDLALSKGFKHPGVYKAYPDAKKISYTPTLDNSIHGMYQNADEGGFLGETIRISKSSPDEKSTTLHEIQHAIQDREGWSGGGMPAQFSSISGNLTPELSALQDELGRLRALPWTPEVGKQFESVNQQMKDLMGNPYESYRRLAGEAEARLTQSRMGLDAAQRLQHYPYDQGPYGLDVPLDSLIVRGLLDGPAMSGADDAAKVARQPTQYELAHQVAQKNAVDMLGLPPNNTAMDRARAMGAEPMYHGSASDIQQLDPAMYGSSTGAHSAKQAFWGVSDPTTAGGYAEYAATGAPVKRLLDQADQYEKAGNWDKYDEALAAAEKLEPELYNQPLRGQNIMPLMVMPRKPAVMDAKGAEFVDVEGGVNKFLRSAKLGGKDAAIFKNMSDDVGRNARPADHYAILDPSIVRSRFAAFDPARRNENDLLAGLAPYIGIGGLLSLGLMTPEQAQANK